MEKEIQLLLKIIIMNSQITCKGKNNTFENGSKLQFLLISSGRKNDARQASEVQPEYELNLSPDHQQFTHITILSCPYSNDVHAGRHYLPGIISPIPLNRVASWFNDLFHQYPYPLTDDIQNLHKASISF